jgi:adenylyl- and sulfurtransferase ThiI
MKKGILIAFGEIFLKSPGVQRIFKRKLKDNLSFFLKKKELILGFFFTEKEFLLKPKSKIRQEKLSNMFLEFLSLLKVSFLKEKI